MERLTKKKRDGNESLRTRQKEPKDENETLRTRNGESKDENESLRTSTKNPSGTDDNASDFNEAGSRYSNA